MKRVTSLFYTSDSKVFISYRRTDSTAYAGRLRSDLRARFGAEQVFMDFENIAPGEQFDGVIETAVNSSTVMVAMIGKLWSNSGAGGANRLSDPRDYVRREIAAALERGIPVIPVLVQRATLPDAQLLPDALTPLLGRQALEIADERWDYDVGRLIQSIESHAKRGALRKSRVLVFATLLIAIIVGGASLISRYRSVASRYRNVAQASVAAPEVPAALQLTSGSELESSYDSEKAKVRFSVPIVAENTSDKDIVIMEMKSDLKPLLPAANPVHLLGFESALTQDGKPLETPITLQKGSHVLSYSVVFEVNDALRAQSTTDFMQELTLKMITSGKERYALKLCFTVDGFSKEMKERKHFLEECSQE